MPRVILIESLDSTNSYLKELTRASTIDEYTIVQALEQTGGRGLGDNKWHSSKGENATFSFLLKPQISASEQFVISQKISLGILRFLQQFEIPAQIKWPNDIYVHNKKIAGILIENTLVGDKIKNCIVGIGLNVNEKHFPDTLPNAVSLQQLKNKTYHIDEVVIQITTSIQQIFLSDISDKEIKQQYLLNLLGYRQYFKYKAVDDQISNYQIIDVTPQGKLILSSDNESVIEVAFKEISLML